MKGFKSPLRSGGGEFDEGGLERKLRSINKEAERDYKAFKKRIESEIEDQDEKETELRVLDDLYGQVRLQDTLGFAEKKIY